MVSIVICYCHQLIYRLQKCAIISLMMVILCSIRFGEIRYEQNATNHDEFIFEVTLRLTDIECQRLQGLQAFTFHFLQKTRINMYPGDDASKCFLLLFTWTYTVQATCPDYNGETPIAREHISDGTWTGVHVGNPITCDGFVTGWRFFPTRAVEFIALVMRPYVAADNKYAVVGRTIIPAQEVLNQIREFTLQKSDWIPVRSGDSIGIKFDVSPIPYGNSDTPFLFTTSISKHELLFGTIHTFDRLYMETYSLQAVLKDSYLPCHIINWPLMKTTTDIATASRIWMDDWNKIKCPGTITGWRFIAGGPGDIIALVYRAVDADNNIYEVVGKTTIPSPADRDVVTEFKLTYPQQIDVIPGDKIGVTYTDAALYVLTVTFSDVATIYKFTDKPDTVEIGTQITFTEYFNRRFMFDAVLDAEKPNDVHRSTLIANDHKLQNNNIAITTSKSMGTCVIKCVENEQCKSVNYNQNHMTCELNDATREEDNGNFVAEDGERYIETSRSITVSRLWL
ncbi:uncharacterized protein LOC117122759 [Anneissia japonica]|uniref:uncharacterized protein LOC117122759 n=1 Tax=Anneissia japonica TaxID=1529436 RepID=UPI001425791C|nr:uncharacterized protein LOC117122759 [Anneissia japonica]